jgi:hypothetical protein
MFLTMVPRRRCVILYIFSKRVRGWSGLENGGCPAATAFEKRKQMKPLMYRQRPAVPALMTALGVLIIGGLLAFDALNRHYDGSGSMDVVWLVVCLTLCIAVMCLIAAFARYQFFHLWKNPDPSVSRKALEKRKNGLP